jgi:hypothetical protein
MPGVRETIDCSFSACRMGIRRVIIIIVTYTLFDYLFIS